MKQSEKAAIAFVRGEQMKKFVGMPVQTSRQPFCLISTASFHQALALASLIGAGAWWGFVPLHSFTLSGIRNDLLGMGIFHKKLIGLFSDAERDYLQAWGDGVDRPPSPCPLLHVKQ